MTKLLFENHGQPPKKIPMMAGSRWLERKAALKAQYDPAVNEFTWLALLQLEFAEDMVARADNFTNKAFRGDYAGRDLLFWSKAVQEYATEAMRRINFVVNPDNGLFQHLPVDPDIDARIKQAAASAAASMQVSKIWQQGGEEIIAIAKAEEGRWISFDFWLDFTGKWLIQSGRGAAKLVRETADVAADVVADVGEGVRKGLGYSGMAIIAVTLVLLIGGISRKK